VALVAKQVAGLAAALRSLANAFGVIAATSYAPILRAVRVSVSETTPRWT